MNKRLIIGALSLAVLATLFAVNFGANKPRLAQAAVPRTMNVPQPPLSGPVGNTTPQQIQNDLTSLISSVRSAVVSIAVSQPNPAIQRHPGGMQFLNPFPGRNGWVGTGTLVHKNGYVITTEQVAGQATKIRVKMFRGGQNTFFATRVASDPGSDLVLFKLPFGGNLPYLPLGDSNTVRTGDIVVAVGSPFGLAETATQGIVSAHRRQLIVEGRQFNDVLQTDASINQGNAGGPLINIQGEMVGVNMAIYSPDSTFSGIGFAIASNRSRQFIAQSGLRGRQ